MYHVRGNLLKVEELKFAIVAANERSFSEHVLNSNPRILPEARSILDQIVAFSGYHANKKDTQIRLEPHTYTNTILLMS